MNRWTLLVAVFLLAALPRAARALEVSEFMAVNDTTLADGYGEFSDWIEVHNPGDVAVAVAGLAPE